jgi:hypothetical protein
MPKIPHSVIAGLLAGSQDAPGAIGAPHPDANLLSAFSENTLQKRERAQLMEHLAQCPQCRDVLALQAAAATQMGEEASRAKSPQRHRGWLASTELRWAAVAASLAVVAGIFLLRQPERVYQDRTPSSLATSAVQPQVTKRQDSATAENKVEIAKKENPHVPENQISREATEQTSSFGPPPRPAPSGSASSAGYTIVAPWENLRAGSARHSAKPATAANARAAAAKTTTMPAPATSLATANDNFDRFDREILKDKGAAPTPPAMTSNAPLAASAPAASGSAAAPTVSSETVDVEGRPEPQSARRAAAVRDQKVETQQSAADTNLATPIVTLNDQAVHAQEYPAIPGLPGYSPRKLPARLPPPGERWRVKQGMLQMSENSGQTWDTVSPGRGPGGLLGLISARRAQEVWAGDSQGGLSHSTDGGQHWQRVLYGGTENIEGATIVSVAIPSSGHVVIKNSAGHTWITRDGGKSWRMK